MTVEPVRQYYSAVRRETEIALSAFEHEPVEVASIYIGGGTPSLIDLDFLEQWIALVQSYAVLLPGFEFTIEANPESLTNTFTGRTRNIGVNRIVIGVQSFAVKTLRRLNRRVNAREIYRAFYLARLAGYDNIGADLIFGLPGQNMKSLRLDLDRLIALEPTHISFYQLTVEPQTRLSELIQNGVLSLPGEETLADMYRRGVHQLIDHGYLRYEVSNFAFDGYACRHNQAYWTGAPYLGLGPSAHGYINGCRYANFKNLAAYCEAIDQNRFPLERIENLSTDQRLTEQVMLALRTSDGIDRKRFLYAFGERGLVVMEGAAAARMEREGYIERTAESMRLTDKGFLVADELTARLLAEASD